jgi:hypothetical protein
VRKTLIALFGAALLAAPASAFAAPALTGLTLTPTIAFDGRIALRVTGRDVGRYLIEAECPEQLYLKSGARNLCEGTHRLPAKRFKKKLWLNLRNPNDVVGAIKITVTGIGLDGEEETAPRSISLVVKETAKK